MKQIVDYIIRWLCYGNDKTARRVAYSSDRTLLKQYDVLITPSGHLGGELVLPDMHSISVDQVRKGKYIISTDIVYAVFFFTSRAEELINPQRDEHQRFSARQSILGLENRLLIPLLDEYARSLIKCLEEPLPRPGFDRIYLTHDIDSLCKYRSLRGALGGIKRGEWREVFAAIGDIQRDPYYTFPWLAAQDKQVAGAQALYFVKHTPGRGYDAPQYKLDCKDYKNLEDYLLQHGAMIAVHNSYYDTIHPLTPSPIHPLITPSPQRTHYLRCPIEKMRKLSEMGYTDDFTMGFADRAGFRLQTTRPIRWIDPEKMQLTDLMLHPLSIMDTTLSEAKYMNLNEDEAYFLCQQIIDKVRMHHGELCLLWHNSNINNNTYHKSLYPKLLSLIK